MEKVVVKGQGLVPLVKRLRVKAVPYTVGVEEYDTSGLHDTYDVVALGMYRWQDGSSVAVAWLAIPGEPMRMVALDRLIVVEMESGL